MQLNQNIHLAVPKKLYGGNGIKIWFDPLQSCYWRISNKSAVLSCHTKTSNSSLNFSGTIAGNLLYNLFINDILLHSSAFHLLQITLVMVLTWFICRQSDLPLITEFLNSDQTQQSWYEVIAGRLQAGWLTGDEGQGEVVFSPQGREISGLTIPERWAAKGTQKLRWKFATSSPWCLISVVPFVSSWDPDKNLNLWSTGWRTASEKQSQKGG